MSFITGPVTNANPGPTLYAIIETAATALGWTLVDTVVIGGNTHKVLKSAGASGGNSQGLDWYLDINYPTTGTTGGMRFAPFEGYNATTHVATNGPYTAGSTTVNATGYSAFGASASALETNWYNTASHVTLSAVLTTSFTYFISITRDFISAILTSDATALCFTGFFTPSSAHSSAAGANLFPLVMTRMLAPSALNAITASSSTASSSAAAFTRAPGAPTGSWFNWASSCLIGSGTPGMFSTGQIGGGGASPFTSDQSIATGIPVYMGWNTTSYTTGSSIPALVGAIPSGIGVGMVGSGVAIGNTVTIGSDTWYCTTQNGGALFLKGV